MAKGLQGHDHNQEYFLLFKWDSLPARSFQNTDINRWSMKFYDIAFSPWKREHKIKP